jgi:hypothetical protein
MAQFRAVIKGQRGEASRLGGKNSGIQAVVNGWNIGVEVWATFDKDTGENVFTIYKTGGSLAGASKEIISQVRGL